MKNRQSLLYKKIFNLTSSNSTVENRNRGGFFLILFFVILYKTWTKEVEETKKRLEFYSLYISRFQRTRTKRKYKKKKLH